MARYSIIRMQKFKMGDVQGIQKHNQRQAKNSSNKDIDSSRTKLNYDLLNPEKIKYERLIKQKISERVKRKPRENSVVLCEFLISASPEYMEKLSPEEQKRYFETSLEHIQLKYGPQNVLYASVHNDEANPHMHVGITPITDDNRLSAKDIFNGKQVMAQLQTDFNDYVNEHGFKLDRGESSDRKNVEIHKFKKEKLEEKISDLEYEVNMVHDFVAEKKVELDKLTKIEEGIKRIDDIKIEKGGLFSSKMVKLAVEDFDSIKTLAKASETTREDNRHLKNENGRLREENIDLKKRNQSLVQELEETKRKNRKLEKALDHYKAAVEILYTTIESIKRHSDRFLKVSKEKMGEYIGEMRLLKLDMKYGKMVFEKEYIEKNIPEDERVGAEKYIEKAKRLEMREKELEQPKQADKPVKRKSKDDFELER